MNLLALETAVGVPTMCLRIGDESLAWRGLPRPGPETILAAAKELLMRASLEPGDLDAVACGRGPGAFTGVRLGIALAQGFALGAGCPIVAVSELAALAWNARRVHGWERVAALLDARQGEIYQAAYDCAAVEPRIVAPERLIEPRGLMLPSGEWAFAGGGAALVAVAAEVAVDVTLVPDASAVAELAAAKFERGEVLAPGDVRPIYLRERVATPK